MPPKTPIPKTRADEIVRARGLEYREIAERTGLSRFHVSRVLTGAMPLSEKFAHQLAKALGCDLEQLTAPIGSAIPPRPEDRAEKVLRGAEYVHRLHALAEMIGTDIDGLMRFQVYGDMSRIPDLYADRLRKALKMAA